jgi:dGTP triphosphohydrolase
MKKKEKSDKIVNSGNAGLLHDIGNPTLIILEKKI